MNDLGGLARVFALADLDGLTDEAAIHEVMARWPDGKPLAQLQAAVAKLTGRAAPSEAAISAAVSTQSARAAAASLEAVRLQLEDAVNAAIDALDSTDEAAPPTELQLKFSIRYLTAIDVALRESRAVFAALIDELHDRLLDEPDDAGPGDD